VDDAGFCLGLIIPFGKEGLRRISRGFKSLHPPFLHSCRLLIEMLRLSCDYLGMKLADKILAKAYERGEINRDQKALRKVFEFEMSF
jgi:hypothetical protein